MKNIWIVFALLLCVWFADTACNQQQIVFVPEIDTVACDTSTLTVIGKFQAMGAVNVANIPFTVWYDRKRIKAQGTSRADGAFDACIAVRPDEPNADYEISFELDTNTFHQCGYRDFWRKNDTLDTETIALRPATTMTLTLLNPQDLPNKNAKLVVQWSSVIDLSLCWFGDAAGLGNGKTQPVSVTRKIPQNYEISIATIKETGSSSIQDTAFKVISGTTPIQVDVRW